MINDLINFVNQWQMTVNFMAHLMIFVGTFYVAFYNTRLPQWHVTPLWYAGLISAFTAMTIMCQWVFGPEFELSYRNLGLVAETCLNIAIAAIALIMLISTRYRNRRAAKKKE